MSTIASEEALVRCFRPVDRPEVELPRQIRYPLEIDHVFTWSEGPRGLYLCSGLSCLERSHAPPSPDDLQKGLSYEQRAERTIARIASFAERTLGAAR